MQRSSEHSQEAESVVKEEDEWVREGDFEKSSRPQATEQQRDKEQAKATEASGPFVNQGLRRWERGRSAWLRLGDGARTRDARRRPPVAVDDEVIYDTIFSKPMGWLLPQPVPLAHMVELLEDEWSD